MFAFFQSRHVKQGRAFVKDAKKLLAYKRDLVPAETIAEVEGEIAGLEEAVRGRDKKRIEERAHRLDHSCGKLTRPVADSGWRENCEVFLVAIVIALGVRTYFLQPFTIPTGSMQPTLNGIRGYRSEASPPNIAVQLWETLWAGRTYVDKVAKSDETIVEVSEVKSLLPFIEKTPFLGNVGFFSRTRIRTDRNSYIIKENPAPVMRDFLTAHAVGRGFKKGDPIVRGYFEAGDHVFVDKMTYHFRPPKRGEVFVFNTQNIATGDNLRMQMRGPSQYYIKRLAGLPGDTLRIDPPELLINGKRAGESGYQRVMSLEGGYRGYSNQSEQELATGVIRFRMKLLGAPDEVFHVPARNYFALGDNSFHSSDSRDWGSVPEQNVMGRGVFVYWPFRQHFGVIR